MNYSLADSLDVLLPSVPAELVAPTVAPRLRQLARALPPIHRCALECRLGVNVHQVDLSQCFLPRDGEPAIAGAWIASRALASGGPVHPAWDRVLEFCARWADPCSPLHAGVPEAWLEFDLDDRASAIPPPSIYVGLQRDAPPDRAYTVAEEALGVLLDDTGQEPPALRLCPEAYINGVLLHWVGVMLSRQTDALRVCTQVRGTDPVVPYLLRVGWPGPIDELDRLLAEWVYCPDADVMIDIDVSARVHPKVGLELCFEEQPADEPRWAALLDTLVARELCTSAKRDALLAWPGVTAPPDGPVSWPGHLIVESLSLPTDRFSVFLRRLLHVKIVYQPGRPLEAKAYLYFEHSWGQQLQAQSADKERL